MTIWEEFVKMAPKIIAIIGKQALAYFYQTMPKIIRKYLT